jgi:hypothetical protein
VPGDSLADPCGRLQRAGAPSLPARTAEPKEERTPTSCTNRNQLAEIVAELADRDLACSQALIDRTFATEPVLKAIWLDRQIGAEEYNRGLHVLHANHDLLTALFALALQAGRDDDD